MLGKNPPHGVAGYFGAAVEPSFSFSHSASSLGMVSALAAFGRLPFPSSRSSFAFPSRTCFAVLLFMSFQLVVVYLFYLFIFIYLFIYFLYFFFSSFFN